MLEQTILLEQRLKDMIDQIDTEDLVSIRINLRNLQNVRLLQRNIFSACFMNMG